MAMDLFKRNNAGLPRSRQGSFDAAIPDTESCLSSQAQASSSSLPDLPSPPERHLKDLSGARRSSVFTLRSRSNTASSMSKPTNLDSQERAARRSSRDMSAAHASSASVSEPPQLTKPKSSSSMFASRGRKLRRQSSKLTSATGIDDVEEVSSGRRGSVFGKDRKRSTYETVEQCKSPTSRKLRVC